MRSPTLNNRMPPDETIEAYGGLPQQSPVATVNRAETLSLDSGADTTPPAAARSVRWWEPTYIALITFLIYALVTPRILTYLSPATGDEPFYLMTATSLIKDGDLNECNNYRQRDEATLYPVEQVAKRILPNGWQGWDAAPYPLPPHPARIQPASRMCLGTNLKRTLTRGIPSIATPLPRDGTQNELYSKHGLGLSLLVTLPYWLGERTLVIFFLNALGALLAANIYLLARESTGKLLIGLLVWVAFAFTVPLMPYSFLIFPELPAALLVAYTFRRIRLGDNGWLRLLAIGLCMAFLPWLHYRFVPLSIGLFAYFVYRLLRTQKSEIGVQPSRIQNPKSKILNRPTALALVLVPAVVSALLMMGYFYFLYGHVWPNADDHAGINDFAGTMRGIAGSFLDEQWGLLVYAPIYILVIVGAILMATERRWRGDLLWIGIITLPYFLIVANYAQWWGEWCPPARYLTSILPLMALPFAVTFSMIRGSVYKIIYTALLLLSFVMMGAFIYQPQWMYNQPSGTSASLSQGIAQVVDQLPPEIIGQLPAGLLPHTEEKTGNRVVTTFGWFPTYVIPYFGYAKGGEEGQKSGDYWAQQAWVNSLWQFVAIFVIVIICLLLAYSQTRRNRQSKVTAGTSIEDYAVPPPLLNQHSGTESPQQ